MDDTGWISVEDRLPEVGERVLITCLSAISKGQVVNITRYEGANWRDGYNGIKVLSSHVTHWMPLPELPGEPS